MKENKKVTIDNRHINYLLKGIDIALQSNNMAIIKVNLEELKEFIIKMRENPENEFLFIQPPE